MESNCVPPGFRFHPTDEELVGYYLKKKVASEKIDLDVIRDIDLYRIEPWDLQEWCRIGYEEQKEWYFFSHKDKKYPTGTRTNRATMVGFWKATGRDKSVYDHKNKKLIGMRKTLVFYKGRAPNGQKTDWIIHEYRLESDENRAPQEEGWVVCRAFKKRTNNLTQNNKANAWDSSLSNYYYDDQPSGVISISSNIDSIDYINPRKQQQQHEHQHQQQNLICKQEIESDNILNCLKSSQLHDGDIHHFLEMLPQLESPSLPSVKTPRFMSSPPSVSVTNEDDDQEQYLRRVCEKNKSSDDQKVMDWRALDKFVASQLSQEDRHDGEGDGGGGSITITTTNAAAAFDEITDHDLPAHYNSSDMELILLQSMINRRDQEVVEEENRLNGFLIIASSSGSPSVDCENNSIIRVCI